jgi:hypothetical protein
MGVEIISQTVKSQRRFVLDELPATGSTLQKFGHGFGARAHMKFFVNPADISVNGLVADV